MIVGAIEVITGVEGGIGRDALLKGIRTVLNIAEADLEPERLTAAFPSRALFSQAKEMKLDLMGIAKEVVAVSYADLGDGDKELSRQIPWIMFPAFCAKFGDYTNLASAIAIHEPRL